MARSGWGTPRATSACSRWSSGLSPSTPTKPSTRTPSVAAGRSWSSARMSYTSFRQIVLRHYRAHGRHDLPWRKTRDPYKILVSEVMLQQTRVDRVIPFYKKFVKQFPTAKWLAAAPLADVLAAWSGLGYNRRALHLREAAQSLSKWSYRTKKTDYAETVRELEKLPGVGPYTARAVAAFA